MNKILLILFLIIISAEGFSQFNRELLSLNYSYAPMGNDDYDFSKIEMNISMPFKLKNGFLRNSINLNYYNMNFRYGLDFNTKDLEKVYGINYDLMYTYHLSSTWSVALRGGISLTSNFTNRVNGEDIQFTGGVVTEKNGGTLDKPFKFIFGLGYATITGEPRIIPLVSYSKKVNDKFSYEIGFPRTYASYNINERSTLKSMLWMNGFYSNLSDPIDIRNVYNAEKSSFSAISLGLDYSYRMDENWVIVLKGGYSFNSKYDLLDNDNNMVYSFDSSSRPYISTGIKFNLKRKFNNRIK